MKYSAGKIQKKSDADRDFEASVNTPREITYGEAIDLISQINERGLRTPGWIVARLNQS